MPHKGDENLEPLLVGLPTHDGRAVVTSITALSQVGNLLERPVVFLIGQASNIPRSRNLVLNEARSRPEVKRSAWILWMDSDILIPADAVQPLSDAISRSEESGQSWAAHYRMASGESVLISERDAESDHHYTLEELAEMQDMAEIAMGGLGLAYLFTPLDYVFHADVVGEDVHFFLDHPDLRLHYAKHITVYHHKTVVL